MKVPKYIKKMIIDREKAQSKSNALQIEIERWFEKHGIEIEWKNTHIALYVEENVTRSTYLEALNKYEKGQNNANTNI